MRRITPVCIPDGTVLAYHVRGWRPGRAAPGFFLHIEQAVRAALWDTESLVEGARRRYFGRVA